MVAGLYDAAVQRKRSARLAAGMWKAYPAASPLRRLLPSHSNIAIPTLRNCTTIDILYSLLILNYLTYSTKCSPFSVPFAKLRIIIP